MNLHKEQTLSGVDMKNTSAIKGDDSDGKVVWSIRSIFAAIFLAALYTGSQIILYFTGGSLSFIGADLGITRGLLFGKRYIALFGSFSICLGCALVGSAQNFGQAIVGMALSGVGAAIGELTRLAGLAEVVSVKYRGYSLALVTAFVLPFCPYLLYVELWSHRDLTVGWRWGPWVSLIYNGIVGIGLLLSYFPKAHTRADGFSRRDILKKIDYVGGVLSIMGLTLFLVALNSGGYTHEWNSAYILWTLLFGIALIAAWVRIVGFAYVIAFAAGMNFFSILNFFPVTFTSVYEPDPVKIVLLMTCFAGSLAVMTPENEHLVVGLGSIASLGIGGVLVPAATVAMIVCPDALITTAAALSLSICTVGGSIGYSIYYNIFATKLEQNLPKYAAEYAIKAGLPVTSAVEFVTIFLTAPATLETTQIEGATPAVIAGATKGVQWAYSQSLRYVWVSFIRLFGIDSCIDMM
ncbi:hypothetical protein EJ07DRAFT_168801 [Lizonia empirigonia]|nr:hypothetical protein EJ07DRAFT_168801 [Lizonia empirigonia]